MQEYFTAGRTFGGLDKSIYFDNFRNMELEIATGAFQALAHETRLRAFRLIVEAGTDGLAAGDIARALDVPASTLSSHLAILERAELITSKRVQRSILYAVDGHGVRAIIDFLTRDCCRGAPELCGLGAAPQPGSLASPSKKNAGHRQ